MIVMILINSSINLTSVHLKVKTVINNTLTKLWALRKLQFTAAVTLHKV
jgi:hypothetical protein